MRLFIFAMSSSLFRHLIFSWLHPCRLQLRILLRAIQLLKPGGRLVYSTCSMSPMENEAVVSAALHQCPGELFTPLALFGFLYNACTHVVTRRPQKCRFSRFPTSCRA